MKGTRDDRPQHQALLVEARQLRRDGQQAPVHVRIERSGSDLQKCLGIDGGCDAAIVHAGAEDIEQEQTLAALRPHLAGGRWLNYLGDDQAEDAIRAAYGANYERLQDVKKKYDPDNIFRSNLNNPVTR